jgi:hypothetical protein
MTTAANTAASANVTDARPESMPMLVASATTTAECELGMPPAVKR